MLHISLRTQFKRELKLQQKRGKDLKKFIHISKKLAAEEELDFRYRNHPLKGDYKGYWEFHLEPDWLIIYYKTKTELIFVRTGTHSDLFK